MQPKSGILTISVKAQGFPKNSWLTEGIPILDRWTPEQAVATDLAKYYTDYGETKHLTSDASKKWRTLDAEEVPLFKDSWNLPKSKQIHGKNEGNVIEVVFVVTRISH